MDFWQKALVEARKEIPSSIQMPKKTKSNYRFRLEHWNNEHYLSKRETQCIYWSMLGMTFKETAKKMNLSPRTVEFYFKRIKERFQIRKKKDLMIILEESGMTLKSFTENELDLLRS